MRLTVSQYRNKKRADFIADNGFIDDQAIEEIELLVKRYAVARQRSNSDFNPFTNDPNCKSCGKGKVNGNNKR